MPLFINEIFDSFQGEGIHAGRFCTFVRFEGCSVGCPWCDTKYAARYHTGCVTPPEDIEKGCLPFVVLTGGEPLEQDLKSLDYLCGVLLNTGHQVCIETAGHILFPHATCNLRAVDGIGVSPKVGFWLDMKVKQAILRWNNYHVLYDIPVWFKFVVDSLEDVYHVIEVLKPLQKIMCTGKCPFILQPQGLRSIPEIKRLQLQIVRDLRVKSFVKQSGFDIRLLPQQHRLLWGRGKRGV